jgi:lysophospholipase L1-like esterase
MVSTLLAGQPQVSRIESAPRALVPVAAFVGGRVVRTTGAGGEQLDRFQWPGVYWTTEFKGERLYFRIGPGDAIYHVLLDHALVATLSKPAAGLYRLDGIADDVHSARIEVASENQSAAASFGGFSVDPQTKAGGPKPLARRVEFIGDSHTVGYGNTSPTRQCTPEQVWATTDTSQAWGVLAAKQFGADYRINAISGRGIVRNYNGGPGATLPEAYPWALFDRETRADDRDWHPQIVVVGLGTNDFSTPLNAGERWKTRGELHADYERSYVAFVQELRRRYPGAFFVLAANDGAEGEMLREVRRVVEALVATGERRVAFLALPHLELTACDWHPSLADHRAMAAALVSCLEARGEVWTDSRRH